MRLLQILFILATLVSQVIGQYQPGAAQLVTVGFARGDDSVQAEVYYSIMQGALSFADQGGGVWSAPLHTKVVIYSNDKLVAEREVQKKVNFKGTKEELAVGAANLSLDVQFFSVPYSSNLQTAVIFYVNDLNGKAITDTLKARFYAPRVKADSFTFSGIELASSLLKADAGNVNPFEKVGYIVTPNPSQVFGREYSKLYYYVELYPPKSKAGSKENINVTTRILDGSLNEVSKKSQTLSLGGGIVPHIATFDVDGLATDSYMLEIVAEYESRVVARIARSFYVESGFILSEEEDTPQSQQVLSEDVLFQTSDISKMSDLELTDRVAQAEYIMSDDERKSFKKITANQELRRAYFAFWRTKDQQGTQPLSEYRTYLKRVAEANKKFTYQKTLGWKSARGRVWIVYGPPDRDNSELFSTEAKPYIIWYYYNRGYRLTSGSSAEFVFVDKFGGGNFEIVHSNVLGETSQTDWYTREAMRLR